MNPLIFTLIEQGLTLLPILVQTGVDITNRVEQLIALNKAASGGSTISDTDLAKIRADFDADLNSFNTPID